VRLPRLVRTLVLVLVVATAACTSPQREPDTPGLAARGTTVTTVKPARQDLANRVSLTGKVTMNPVFGLVSPVDGEVRYLDVRPPQRTPTRPTRVAAVWAGGRPNHVAVPAGAVFAGRLVDDRSTVTAGMPIVSARHVGYAVVADIDGGQAYRITDGLTSVQAQIKSGPGPFVCSVLGTIAALPAGTIPEPPAPSTTASAPPPGGGPPERAGPPPSDPTGLRLVCTAPADVKLINGAAVTLEVLTERAANVLVLPVEAVAGSQGRGLVDVVRADGTRETREVTLGLSDGRVVEIRSGLTGDETVAIPGPNLPAATDQGNPGGPPK
jgi:hypothetical protein